MSWGYAGVILVSPAHSISSYDTGSLCLFVAYSRLSNFSAILQLALLRLKNTSKRNYDI
jgi:hypothetical protein